MSLPYKATDKRITNREGKSVKLYGCFVSSYGTPRGGWGCEVIIKGSSIEVAGNSPIEVFKSLHELLTLNGEDHTIEDCWLNLNIIWFDRVHEKYREVDLVELLTAARVLPRGEMQNRSYPPSEWGQHVWRFMGCYLSGDLYSWSSFRQILGITLDMLNPAKNPSTGGGEAYISLLSEVEGFDRIENMKLYNRADARNWLVDYHNSVNVRLGKQMVSYKTAAKKYLWL